MLFNSFDFALFLPITFLVYWFVLKKHLFLQNLFIVIASYVFYGWWDWRFLSLIFFSTLVDYFVGLGLKTNEKKHIRKTLLLTSIIVNLGLLGFFKYYNFFVENFVKAFEFFGQKFEPTTLNIILPVGISFYTFQTLSYSIDVYRRKIEPTKDFIAFAAFVSFFPQLVAGPIERATNLLPQFYKKREFNYSQAVDGMRQILWGLFKKIVIADNCAEYVNLIYSNSSNYSGMLLLFGTIMFAFQIYGDFSGYSDIAIGTARLFGFSLMQNFAFPYFSRDIAEFWRRWHISLSTWFRDYVYIPLGGSKGNMYSKIRNTFIIFVVSGFWHGANWTFIAWGLLNAIYFLPLLLLNKNRKNIDIAAKGKLFPSFKEFIQIAITFILTNIAWIYFRAENLLQANNILLNIFNSLFKKSAYVDLYNFLYWQVDITFILILLCFILIEWLGREQKFAIEKLLINYKRPLRWALYYTIVFVIIYFSGTQQQFIYFQF